MLKSKSLSFNFLVFSIRTIIVSFAPLIVFPYVSRILGAEGIGKVQFIQSIASYFQLFATFGITTYGIREGSFLRDDPESLKKLTLELIIINAITTFFALFGYALAVCFLDSSKYWDLALIFSLYILFYGINFDWYYNVHECYIYITIRTIVGYLVSFAIVFLGVRNNMDTNIYACSIVIPYAVNFFVNGFEIFKKEGYTAYKNLSFKKHLIPLLLIFSTVVSSSIYLLLDTTMLGILNGDKTVGYYTAASKLCRFGVQGITTVFTVFTPRLGYYIGKNKTQEFTRLGTFLGEVTLFIAVPLCFVLIAFSDQAIVFFSGKEYLPASPALRILSINLVFSAFDGFLGWQILVPNGKEKCLFFGTVVGCGVDLLLNAMLIPHLGLNGAAIATLVTEIMVFSICFFASRKYLLLNQMGKEFLKILVASFPIFILHWGIISARNLSINLIQTILFALSLCILYICILLLEKSEVISMLFKAVLSKIQKYEFDE